MQKETTVEETVSWKTQSRWGGVCQLLLGGDGERVKKRKTSLGGTSRLRKPPGGVSTILAPEKRSGEGCPRLKPSRGRGSPTTSMIVFTEKKKVRKE